MLKYKELTPETWYDFEKLFGDKGACDGCWCTYWRQSHSEYNKNKGEFNKKIMKSLVESGHIPGLLFYENSEPVAWCSISPRKDFVRLEKSKILKSIDNKDVISITCFFIPRVYRGKGLQKQIIEHIINYCKTKAIKIIEAYPIAPKKSTYPPAFAWTGFASIFIKLGFKEVARRSETRPIMRLVLKYENSN
jgi:predicted GNAT family acetyltransferase